MRYTNDANLPAPIVAAIVNDDYSAGDADISVTGLIAPARQRALTHAHADDLVEDVSDHIWSLLGKSVHEILRRAGAALILEETLLAGGGSSLDDPPELPRRAVEERLFITVGGWRISGQFDHCAYTPDGTLDDYKVTSVWSVKDGGKADWDAQLNCYAHMLRLHGRPVTRLHIVAILRDWRKNEALRYGSSGYPPRQEVVLDVPLWPEARTVAYLEERVRLHQEARAALATGAPLPHCTREERWQKAEGWAVMRKGRKSAVRVCQTAVEANLVKGKASDDEVWIEYRAGTATRCNSYCAVKTICVARSDGQHRPGELDAESNDGDASVQGVRESGDGAGA